MATKVTIIGKSKIQRDPNYIEFHGTLIDGDEDIEYTEDEEIIAKPHDWNYIELICNDYVRGLDLMFAYDCPEMRHCGNLYLGHFNDGVVEPK